MVAAIVSAMQAADLEVRDIQSLREHPLTLIAAAILPASSFAIR